MTEKQLIELLDKYGPAIRDAILAGIKDVRDNARLTEIVTMIEQNNVEGALRALGYNPAVFSQYQTLLMQAFEQGGLMIMSMQPKYTPDATGVMTMLRFNVRDREAEAWLAQHSSSLITGIEDDVRLAVRDALQDGLAQGANPRTTALDLVGRYNRETGHREGGIVGLGAREQQWARSVRQKLLTLDPSYFDMDLRDKRFDQIVRDAIESGRPLSADNVTRLVDRYRDRALKQRGDMIGREETLSALQRSEYEATRQALAQSNLPNSAAKKVWDTAGDKRVRHSHEEMDGQTVGIDEPFVTPPDRQGRTYRMMHPHDGSLGAPAKELIMCRCRVRYDIDYLWKYRNGDE